MNRPIRLPLVGAACILVFGCRGDTASPNVDTPMYAVSDGAHNGNPDFFFLPPLFQNPNTSPNYEPTAANMSLKPAVEICELGDAAADGSRECIAGPPVTRFDPSIVTTTSDQAYQVNWKTDASNLNIAKFYRIRVLVGSTLLGFADVDPVSSGSQLRNVQTNEYIGLVDGRTLPIKFRIETGALCAVDGTPCASRTINLAQGGGIELLGGGEDFKVDIPSGTTATFNGQTVTTVTVNLEVCSGIDVDLPTVGACLRLTTFFDATGDGELEFSQPVLVSLCVLNELIHTAEESRQQGLITLHQQDGSLIRALPHADPNCDVIGTNSSGWDWLKSLAARFLAPKPAFAATRNALLHVGAGGETGVVGATCAPPASSPVPGMFLTTTCPPSSPIYRSGPQPSAMATITPPKTVSDFQFALPAKMDYVNPADAQRTATPGTALPTAVKVTDWDGTAVRGARVTFIEPPVEGPGEGTVIGTAISDADGIAQILWTIREGPNHVVATGRGIAAQNNYPDAPVKPFMPDISLPTDEQSPVALGTGRVHFFATSGQADLIIESLTHLPASPTDADLMEYTAVVKNVGTAPAGRFSVQILVNNAAGGSIEVTTLSSGPPGTLLNPGETTSLRRDRTLQLPVGNYVLVGTADIENEVPESDEANNGALDGLTVTPGVIDFETFTGGSPACDNCALTNQFASRGVVFSFTPIAVTGECAGYTNAQLFLSSTVYDPLGGPTNHSATAAGLADGGFCSGLVIMTFGGSPDTVRFRLRGNNGIAEFPVEAFDAADILIAETQIVRSDVSAYTTVSGVLFRQETITIINAGGISRIQLDMNGFGALIDNLLILP